MLPPCEKVDVRDLVGLSDEPFMLDSFSQKFFVRLMLNLSLSCNCSSAFELSRSGDELISDGLLVGIMIISSSSLSR